MKLFTLSLSAALLLITFAPQTIQAQNCTLNTSQGISSGGNGVLPNNENFNTSNLQFYWDNGNGSRNVNFNNNGSLTVVSGSLTLNNTNFNGSATIIVRSGATLTIGGGQFKNIGNNYLIVNYGTINFNGGMALGGNAQLHNHPGAVINVPNPRSFHVNGSAQFINDGTLNAHEWRVQSSTNPSVCLLESSTVNVEDFINNATNSIFGEFLSCMYVGNSAALNNNVSTTQPFIVCSETGSSQSGAANYGDATTLSDCSDCDAARTIILPVSMLSFTANCDENVVRLDWTTASEFNASHFDVEVSRDGTTWSVIGTLEAAGTTNQATKYYFETPVVSGTNYFRLKQVDLDGDYEIYGPLSSVCDSKDAVVMSAYPNPFEETLSVTINAQVPDFNAELQVLDLFGRVIYSIPTDLKEGINYNKLDTSALPQGTYVLVLSSQLNEPKPIKISKK